MTEDTNYSGDVMLTGGEATPVELRGAEDVFVAGDAVSGDLEIVDAEYIYAHASPADADVPDTPETTIDGNIEDGYFKPSGVDGDARIKHAEDVFIAADALSGEFEATGCENVFTDPSANPAHDPTEYDTTVTGWRQSKTITEPQTGVYIVGAKHDITIDTVTEDIELYVVGWDHSISIEGRHASVDVYLLGRDNTISATPYLDVAVQSDPGNNNAIDEAPIPVEDLIETRKSDAFPMFGRAKVTYQEPADDEKYCPNCGEAADAIIERHQMDAFFLFGSPVKVYDKSTTPAKECENCSRNAVSDPELTPEERQEVLQ